MTVFRLESTGGGSCEKMETEELQSQKGRTNIGKNLDVHMHTQIYKNKKGRLSNW